MKKKEFLEKGEISYYLIPKKPLGQDLVEFALVLPLLLLFLFGALDLGRAFFSYIAITNAAREGARYAVSYGFEVESGNYVFSETDISAAVRREANASGIDLTGAVIGVACEENFCDTGRVLRVTVDLPFTPILTGFLPDPTINMQQAVEMMIP